MNRELQPDERSTVLITGPLPPAVGGMATVIDNILASGLADQFHLIAFDTGKVTPEGRSFWTGVTTRLALYREWWRLLRSPRGSTLAHIHTCSGLTYALDGILVLLARLRRVPVIFHIHGGGFETFLQGLGPLRPVAAWLARRASRVVVLSDGWRLCLAPLLPGTSLVVIPNTVPIPESADAITHAREREGAGGIRLLFLGTLCEQKGVLDLVEAFRSLPLDTVLSIAGGEAEPGFASHIDTLVGKAGVSGRVRLLGPVRGDEKAQLLVDHDVFVLPSYVEGLPMSLLEAMAHGMAIVVTDVGAIPTAVTDGEEAVLIRPGDVPALTLALRELIADPVRRKKMGASARQRCQREHSLAVGEQRLAALYDDALGHNSENLAVTS